MRPATLPLQSIYAPIVEDLEAVKHLFDEELQCDLPFINDWCAHIRHYRGKMLRPALLLLSGRACGQICRAHTTLAAVLEMVHMATLVHDDVLDDSNMRRQSPTVNTMSDNETAVLLGDYLISHAYHLCSSLESQYASRTIASCTNTVCEGELLQVSNKRNCRLTQDQYLTIISRKTAALTSVACMLGAKYAGANAARINALESYGMDIGVAFQIVDDILDLVGSEVEMGKTLGRDLDKGKLTLPIIHYLSNADSRDRDHLLELLSNHDHRERERIRERLNGSIEYAVGLAEQRVQSARSALECLPASVARDSLQAVSDFIVLRRF